MNNKGVFQGIDIRKSNDIMFAFDNALYNTACLVNDMNVYQKKNNEKPNPKKKYINTQQNIVNRYEQQLVNEIDDLFNPISNGEGDTPQGMSGFPIYNQGKYPISSKKPENNNNISNLYKNRSNYKPKSNRNNNNTNNNKFIHASKYVLNSKKGYNSYNKHSNTHGY